jgi:hypothetical protein
MRTKRNTVRLAIFAAALLTATSFGGPAKAQSIAAEGAVQGNFTLPYEIHWRNAVLPAGEYVLGFIQGGTCANIWIRNAKTHRIVAYEPTCLRQDGKGDSALVIGARGRQRVVQSLRIKELGETFVFRPPSADRQETEEARQTQTVPILAAQK